LQQWPAWRMTMQERPKPFSILAFFFLPSARPGAGLFFPSA
jgi:hypothetical protein